MDKACLFKDYPLIIKITASCDDFTSSPHRATCAFHPKVLFYHMISYCLVKETVGIPDGQFSKVTRAILVSF